MEELRYPIGKPIQVDNVTDANREQWIREIELLPSQLREVVDGLTGPQLDTPYRPGGWTVRQVVHHIPDSHINSYVRLRLALTEDTPTIRTYHEDRWANLPDARTAPIELSLSLLDALHERWVYLFKSLRPADFHRKLDHPENGEMSVDEVLCLYAWHGRHHVAHIASLRTRSNW